MYGLIQSTTARLIFCAIFKSSFISVKNSLDNIRMADSVAQGHQTYLSNLMKLNQCSVGSDHYTILNNNNKRFTTVYKCIMSRICKLIVFSYKNAFADWNEKCKTSDSVECFATILTLQYQCLSHQCMASHSLLSSMLLDPY